MLGLQLWVIVLANTVLSLPSTLCLMDAQQALGDWQVPVSGKTKATRCRFVKVEPLE